MLRYASKAKGFTLVELVSVIVLLGILSVGITGFIRFTTQAYTDTTDREALIASARFVVERLNRELRSALPKSVEVTGNCIKFTPVLTSSRYLDIPTAPDSSNHLTIVGFDNLMTGVNNSQLDGQRVAVVSAADASIAELAANNAVQAMTSDHEFVVNLKANHQFPEESPAQRLYFIGADVNYCLVGATLTRNNVLMAENLVSTGLPVFVVGGASLERNAIVQARLTFSQNDEILVFNNEVHIVNVP